MSHNADIHEIKISSMIFTYVLVDTIVYETLITTKLVFVILNKLPWLLFILLGMEEWSCVRPGTGLNNPCESFLTQDILWFFDSVITMHFYNSIRWKVDSYEVKVQYLN